MNWNFDHQMSQTKGIFNVPTMEHRTLKNVNSCWNTKFYFYLETSGGQNSNLFLNIVYFFNASVN